MPRTLESILIEAGKTIADPERWTQGTLARDRHGNEVKPTERRAVKFSAEGIICSVVKWKPDDENASSSVVNTAAAALATIDLMANRLFRHSSFYVNDNLGHEATLQIFRAAVKHSRIPTK
jgi:hypothetical protein